MVRKREWSIGILVFLTGMLLLAMIPYDSSAQEEAMPEFPSRLAHERGHWTLTAFPAWVSHPDANPRAAIGMNASVFMGRYVSLNANFAVGRGYFQGGVALLGIPFILLGSTHPGILFFGSLEEFLLSLALIALTFENINFHIPLGQDIELSPYFSLFRIKYIREGYGANGYDTHVNLVLGSSLNIFTTERFFVAPFVETTRDWGPGGLWGLNAGVHLGFYFYGRR